MIFAPFSMPVLVFFLLALLLFLFAPLIPLVPISAFQKLGFSTWQAVAILVLSLVGSFFNIPVRRIPVEEEVVISYYPGDWQFTRRGEVIIALNVGGAIIPILISSYLMWLIAKFFALKFVLGTLVNLGVVSLVAFATAKPVRGLGIKVNALLMPLVAIGVAWFLTKHTAPLSAYIAGTMGTLIGADLLHLKDAINVDVRAISIGGAGTFDAIFLTGIIAALLA